MDISLPVPTSSSCLVMSTVSPNMSYRGFLSPTTPATQGPRKKKKHTQWRRRHVWWFLLQCIVVQSGKTLKRMREERHIFSTNPHRILHPCKHITEFINNRALRRQGESYFLNSEMLLKNSCLPTYRNKSTERHLRAPFRIVPFFLPLLTPLQPALLPEPASRARNA